LLLPPFASFSFETARVRSDLAGVTFETNAEEVACEVGVRLLDRGLPSASRFST